MRDRPGPGAVLFGFISYGLYTPVGRLYVRLPMEDWFRVLRPVPAPPRSADNRRSAGHGVLGTLTV